MPKEPRLSWAFLAGRSRFDHLPGFAQTVRRYLFFWARNAIFHSLKALNVSPGERVLVPAYICAAAVEPIAAYGAEVVFYDVRKDCLPDFSEIEAKIDARTRAVLALHYFGFPQPIQQFRNLCDRRGLWLIEDCAHVLRGQLDGRALGSFGEASVFSWRKFLPLFDGGELVLNCQRELDLEWGREGALFTLKVAKSLVDPLVEDGRHPLLRIPSRTIEVSKNVLLRLVGSSGRAKQPLAIYSSSASFDPEMVNFPMSRLSRMILAHSDIPAVVAKRWSHYLHLQERLGRIDGLNLLFTPLPAGVCPWVFPIFFEDVPDAHIALREIGIPAVTWGGVRYPGISKALFPQAHFLYENLVFLPLHQNLEEQDLELIAAAVRSVCQTGRARRNAARVL